MKKFAIDFGKVLLVILSVILCLCLAVSLLVTVLVTDVRILTDKNNLNTLITGYLTGSKMPYRQGLPAGVSVQTGGKMAPVKKLDDMTDVDDMTDASVLVTYIYDMLQEQAGGELEMSLAEVQDFVEKSTLDDFLMEKSASLVSDFLTGENTTTITMQEIQEQLEQNAALIQETFGIPMDDPTAIGVMVVAIEESDVVAKIQQGGLQALLDIPVSSETNGAVDDATSKVEMQKIPTNLIGIIAALINGDLDLSTMQLPQILNVFRAAISAETMWLCIGVCALLIGLVFLASWSKYYRAMVGVGVTLLDSGVVFLVPIILIKALPDLFKSLLGSAASAYPVLCSALEMLIAPPVVLIVLGLALIVSGSILRHMAKKRKALAVAEAPAEALEEAPVEEVSAEEEAPAEKIPAEEETAAEEETPVAEETASEEEAPVEETV